MPSLFLSIDLFSYYLGFVAGVISLFCCQYAYRGYKQWKRQKKYEQKRQELEEQGVIVARGKSPEEKRQEWAKKMAKKMDDHAKAKLGYEDPDAR